jgi:hypothetical protein
MHKMNKATFGRSVQSFARRMTNKKGNSWVGGGVGTIPAMGLEAFFKESFYNVAYRSPALKFFKEIL